MIALSRIAIRNQNLLFASRLIKRNIIGYSLVIFLLPVETVSVDYCSAHSYINLTLPSGYIASELYMHPDRPSCDHTLYPWVIVAQRGQHINLTLYDFALDNAYGSGFQRGGGVGGGGTGDGERICRQYGWLADNGADRPTQICGGDQRVSEIYVSRGNSVKIWTVAVDKPSDQRKFVIGYTGQNLIVSHAIY